MECGFILCFKNEAGCKKLHPKKMLDVVLFQKKTHWRRLKLLGLGQVNDDNVLHLELLIQWYIWTKTT